jgi:hypothetical protein
MVSHARTDSDFTARLRRDLTDQGFSTWMDQRDIPAGARWDAEIRQAIDAAQVVLVVLSPASVASKWVRKEYRYALRRGKVVIPLRYFPCDIPAMLAGLQAIDFRPTFVNAEAYYAQQFRLLTRAIAGYEALGTASRVRVQQHHGHRPILLVGAAVLGATLAGTAGYAGGALMPSAFRPLARLELVVGCAVLLACGLGLALHLTGRAGSVSLYLKDRERFLAKVHTRYMNLLKLPFEGALMLTLGLSEDAQAVARPPLVRRETPDGEGRMLPAGTGITEAFVEAEGQVLILGAPGAGKSTLLYQLALDLVGHARTDGTFPIPVVFNLASWAQDRKPLEGWMVDQLVDTWQVPRPIARVWVDRRELLPLLDGLDEVWAEGRAACVEAVNRYHHAHGLDLLAVCSRTQDYHAQQGRLDLRKAVVVQPLTPAQIDAYLASGGERLEALRALAQTDDEVRDLVSTPLLLSVVSLAYGSEAASPIPRPSADRAAWTQAVFHDYVQQMLQRRDTPRAGKQHDSYSVVDTARYLAWLAAQMRVHGLVELYLERLQPDWLPDAHARQ